MIKTLFMLVFKMFMKTLEFRSAVKELLKVVLLSRILWVSMFNSPTNLSDSISREPSNSELALLLLFAFRSSQESLVSSLMMTSTVFRIFCK